MDYLFKTTTELTEQEKLGIVALFEDAFNRKTSLEHLFKNYYVLTPIGYSYHAMLKDGERIIGHNAYVPLQFSYRGEKMLFVDTVTSMMSPDYRDFMYYYRMLTASYKKLKEVGIPFVYGHPNDNAYPVVSKSKLLEDIGRMNIYCLPLRVGGIKRKLRVFTPISYCFSWAWVKLCKLMASDKIYRAPIEQDKESFKETRYKRDVYEVFIHKDCESYYKIKDYEGVRTAFLMEVFPKSSQNFVRTIDHIVKKHGKELDLIMYPGKLPFRVTGMINLPFSLHPKQFHFNGHVVNPEVVDKEFIMNIDNWDENLSIYDLV